ncbi:hypothetical protein Salat_2415000 [Sesamum alatum]|uniref:Uncharacterized protein n=1 Tax=Sesamum alatum TaxID=300844 RepID=A0AAE2CFA1_9LAMI|nr:hypothetical protein Salat_2415000 [Sesamum alatum]
MARRRIGAGGGGVVVVMVAVVVLAICVNAQVYTCWGGCYNKCFLRSNGTGQEMLACYYQCFNSCPRRSPADSPYYCQIGCYIELCGPDSNDVARSEKCFGRCTNLCKF